MLGSQEKYTTHFGNTSASSWGWNMGESMRKANWQEFENVKICFLNKLLQIEFK